MKRMWVILGGGVAIVVIAAVVMVFFVLSNLGDIIKTAVERYGPDYTKTEVKLASADISAFDGTGQLTGFLLGNPKGYKTKSAMEVGRLQIAVDPKSLTSNVVHIKRIAIDKANVTYEFGDKFSNLEAIQHNVEQATGGGGKAAGKPAKGGGKESEVKVIIDELVITGSKVQVSHPTFAGKTVTVPLGDLRLTDIGKKQGGVTPGEAAKEIVGALTAKVKGAVGKIDISKLADKLKLGSGKAGETMKDVGGTVGKAAEDAGKKLKKLFGN